MRAIRTTPWPPVDYREAPAKEESAGGVVGTTSRGYFWSGEEPLLDSRYLGPLRSVRACCYLTRVEFELDVCLRDFREIACTLDEGTRSGRQVKVELNSSALLHALVRELTAARCLVRQLDGTSCRVFVLDTRGSKDDLAALTFFVSVWASGHPGAVATVTADGQA